ncbi:MAG: FGGY-family carbohydrate kinase [Thiohalocapsa sp.]|uniref:FGGY-family carbohydrate kinase n=1 Tax=Thiohalocapsa sp. TaxID=2497641 RepID=UPI0025F996D2|nr:FGGY-family carbohydrate kinase [Thiohalocapsa sp.]MCG6940180.1 FGGY-family carbohydrate kinase [Thiohalocapsa sp.]
MSERVGIGVDVGTSGVRAVALDGAGNVLARAVERLPAPLHTAEGGVEQDPECWWDALVRTLRHLTTEVALAGQDCALSLDGTSATVLLTAPDGRPLGPALMYNDRRATRTAAAIAAAAPADSPALGVGSSLAKAMHLRSAGGLDAAEVRVLHQADWLAGRLLGRFGDSDWNNALKLGYDPRAERWPDWLGSLPLPATALPRVHVPGTPLGIIAPMAAAATGLPDNTIICAGTTDSTAAVLATGAADIGDAITSLGSTLVLKVIAERRVSAPEYGVYSHRLRCDWGDAWLVGGASNSGGAALRAHFDDATLARLSARIDPERPSGLDYYPLPAPGERFPVHDPGLAPRLTPRPADDARFLHGLLEGIARIERDGYRLLARLGAPPPRRVLSIGGGAANATWTAMRRRLLGCDVIRAHGEAAAGVAALALRALWRS